MKDNSKLFFYEQNMYKGELRTPAAEIMQVAELAISAESEIKEHRQLCDEITYASPERPVSGLGTAAMRCLPDRSIS